MTRPEEYTVYQATDPGTPPEVLERMAGARPDLRQFVAANPSTAPEVLTWLGGLGDPGVAAALGRRSGAGTSWTSPARTAPAEQPAPAPGGYLPTRPAPDAAPGPAATDPYAPPATNPYAPSATTHDAASGPYSPGGPYAPGAPAPDLYGAIGPRGQVMHGRAEPYAQAYGHGSPYGSPQAAGYGYQPQPPGSRKGLVAAIVVGALVLVGALVFAATQIFSSLGGSSFGSDADLDQLWTECAAGDADACDDLYWNSPFDSEYEEFGDTCGNRQPADTGRWCRDVM